jgi:hypothetical protein
VALVRDGEQVRVHLNGNPQPEIATSTPCAGLEGIETLFLGGRCDNDSNWEGRLDEAAVFGRVLGADEIERLALGNRQ